MGARQGPETPTSDFGMRMRGANAHGRLLARDPPARHVQSRGVAIIGMHSCGDMTIINRMWGHTWGHACDMDIIQHESKRKSMDT